MATELNPLDVFLDLNGDPLDAGKIYIGDPNTDPTDPLNQIAIYWDEAATTPASQPVRTIAGYISNAGVRARIFVSGDYSLTVTQEDDQVISAEAEISGGGAGTAVTSADLANTSDTAKGDALVGFKQSDSLGALTGAAASTVHSKLQEIVSVRDFGAVMDGVTDDSTAIASAKTWALAASNRALYWPAGTALVTVSVASILTVRSYGPGAIKRGTDVFYFEPNNTTTNTIYCSTTGGGDGLTSAQPITLAQAITALKLFKQQRPQSWVVNLAAGSYATVHDFTGCEGSITIAGPNVSGGAPTAIFTSAGNITIAGASLSVTINDVATTLANFVFEKFANVTTSNVRSSVASGSAFTVQDGAVASFSASYSTGACAVGLDVKRGGVATWSGGQISATTTSAYSAASGGVITSSGSADIRLNACGSSVDSDGVFIDSSTTWNTNTANKNTVRIKRGHTGHLSDFAACKNEIVLAFDLTARTQSSGGTSSDFTLFTLPAQSFDLAGRRLRFRICGNIPISTGSAPQVDIRLGTTTALSVVAVASATGRYVVDADVYSSGTDAQFSTGRITQAGAAVAIPATTSTTADTDVSMAAGFRLVGPGSTGSITVDSAELYLTL